MAKHINIPIFIPHEGCPNDCVFCNQRTITGQCQKADRDITKEIDEALSTYTGIAENAEIAFFGGSFTGIDRNVMVRLLDDAYEYVKNGKVSSIRLSTRPDYIDEEILDILKSRSVTHIELGIQSASDKVLSASKRGHTFADTEKACRLINDYGFILGGQMMVGLPSSTVEDEIYTAQKIAELGCKEARIYPTVVFYDTELCEMAKNGAYTPLSTDEAVERCYEAYHALTSHPANKNGNMKVLRIGLHASENLADSSKVYAGANHPAMGELVMSRRFYSLVLDALGHYKEHPEYGYNGKTFVIKCHSSDLSQLIGQHKKNKTAFLEAALEAGFSGLKIITDDSIDKGCISTQFE